LSSAGQVLRFDVKRPGEKDLITLEIEPRREANAKMPSIGITPDASLTLGRIPFEAPAGAPPVPNEVTDKLREGDTLVELGPNESELQKVANSQEYNRFLTRWADQPLVFVFERRESVGPISLPTAAKSPPERISVTLPPGQFVDFGLRMTMEPVMSIQRG